MPFHRYLLVLLASSLPALSLDNSLTIQNWNGRGNGDSRSSRSTMQTARPFTLHRIFAQGEILNYPRPRVNGAEVEPWQADVKQRWRDGNATCKLTMVSEVNGWPRVSCEKHGFQNLETVTISGAGELDGIHTIAEPTTDTFLLRGVNWKGEAKFASASAVGPAPGTVKEAYVSFRADVPAGGTLKVDFINHQAACWKDDPAACEAGLDQEGMLKFPHPWGFRIQATAGGTTKGADAASMLGAGKYRYWLRGPLVTQVVVEDLTPQETTSFGWHLANGTMLDEPDSKYRSLNPRFVLTFYSGWPGVRGECILENTWAGRSQDQVYDLSIQTGAAAPEVVYSAQNLRHYALTRWRKTFWDGQEPGEVRLDHNLPYLIYSRALMPYDASLRPSNRSIESWLKTYLATDRGEVMGNAFVTKDMFQGDEEAGVLQGWDAGYAASGDPRLEDLLFGTNRRDSEAEPVKGGGGVAAVASHVPVYVRYMGVTNNYCRYSCADRTGHGTYGRFYSIEAHPDARTMNSWIMPTYAQVGDRADKRGWAFHPTHMWNLSYLPWLVTGDLYYLEDLLGWSSFLALQPNPGTADYARHWHWGYVNENGMELRGSAWAISFLAHTAFALPDGWPEKELMTRLLETQFAVIEGVLGIPDGWFGPGYPCSTEGYRPGFDASHRTWSGYRLDQNDWCNRWYAGLLWILGVEAGAPNQARRNVLKDWQGPGSLHATTALNPTYARSLGVMYQKHYRYAAAFRVRWFRFPFADFALREAARFFLNLAVHPNGNPWLLTEYLCPVAVHVNPRKAVVEAVRGKPTTLTVPEHGLQAGDELAICCGEGAWRNLDQPTTNRSTGRKVAAVVDANRFTLDVDSSSWPPLAAGKLYIVKFGPPRPAATLTEYKNGFADPNRSKPAGYATDVTSGYPHYALNVAALLSGYQDAEPMEGISEPRTGWEAYQWFQKNIPGQELRPDNLKWSFAPAEILNVTVNAAGAEAVVEWVAPAAAPSKIGITDQFAFPDSSDQGDIPVAGKARQQSHKFTGLEAGKIYRIRITQEPAARFEGFFVMGAADQLLTRQKRPVLSSLRPQPARGVRKTARERRLQ